MAGDLDQISMQIGRILSNNEESGRVREAMFRKLDEIGEKLTMVKGAVETVALSHTQLQAKVEGKVMPAIEEMKALKQRGIGIITAVGVLAGGASAGATKIIGKLLGND